MKKDWGGEYSGEADAGGWQHLEQTLKFCYVHIGMKDTCRLQ